MALFVRSTTPVAVDRLFSTLFDTPTGTAPAAPRRFTPATDVRETEEAFVVSADLPGVEPADVTLEVTDRVLTLSGERAGRGRFARTLRLPQGVEAQAISASFDKGVLEITVPKPAARTPHRVEIATGASAPAIAAEADAQPEA